MTAAYDGLRVLDASQTGAGAMAAMYFADQGADVLRVLPPDVQPVDRDPGFLCWDRNKRLCALDRTSTASTASTAEFTRLLCAADVAVFDDPAQVLEHEGLDAQTLTAANPQLVHLWLPLLPPVEPWGSLPPDRLLADAVTTASGEHGSYDGGPVAMITPVAVYGQGILGATTAAAALLERQRSGRGQGVLVSGLHAVAAMEAAVLTDAEGIARPAQSGGGSNANYRLYRCADGEWLYLGALTEPLFFAALEVLDLVDVLVMPGVEGHLFNMMKPEVGGPVVARMNARFSEKPRAEWERLLTEAGVPNAPAQTRAKWWNSDVVRSNGMRQVRPHPELGDVEIPGDAIRLSRTPGVFSHLPSRKQFVDPATVWTEPRALPRDSAASSAADHAPLAGLRVLDLGSFVAGPFASSLLSDFGAQVIKVEGPGGDPYRAFTVSFLVFHKGQQNVVLDLKQEAGRAALYDLVRNADVLLDNVRPGVRERIGTDYDTLAALNPRLVRATVTAWGSGNSLSTTPAFDPLLQARSGLIAAQGGASAPCNSAMLVHDIGTGALAAFGILAALYARSRDGLGQEVVTTMANSSIMLQSGEFVQYAGRPEPAVGCHDYVGDAALHRLYPCREGWLALAAQTGDGAAGVRRALNVDVSAEDLRAAPATGKVADALIAALAPFTAAEAVARLAAHGVAAAPVLGRGQFVRDPWIAANRLLTRITDPDLGPCTVLRTYAEWSRTRHDIDEPARPPGADTSAVLRDLGYDAARITALLDSGAARGR